MSDLQDELDGIRDRINVEYWTEAALRKSRADVFALTAAVKAVHDLAETAPFPVARDSWDRGYDAACRKILRTLTDKLTGEDNDHP